MGVFKEKLIDEMEQKGPTGPGYGRLDTTGYKERKKDPDEIWRERGYYPDGEKYDYGDDDSDNDKIPEFDPEAAKKAREEDAPEQK